MGRIKKEPAPKKDDVLSVERVQEIGVICSAEMAVVLNSHEALRAELGQARQDCQEAESKLEKSEEAVEGAAIMLKAEMQGRAAERQRYEGLMEAVKQHLDSDGDDSATWDALFDAYDAVKGKE